MSEVEYEGKKIGRPTGGTLLEKVRIERRKDIRINLDCLKPDIKLSNPSNKKRTYICSCCGTEYTKQKDNFISSTKSVFWRGNGGYTTFCKSCAEILMKCLVSFYNGNEEHALRHLCAMFDWYYCDIASAMTLSQTQVGSPRIALYASKAHTRQAAEAGTSFLDTIRDECEERDTYVRPSDVKDDNREEEEDESVAFVVTKNMMRVWGKGFKADEYEFLEEEFTDWTTKNVCNTKSQEELYRNIALAQLDIRRAREKGGKIKEAQDALQSLMNSANILPKQTADNILADTQTFGTLLKKFEDSDPIPEPDEKWKDVDGIRRYMNTWFRGGLAKALKIKNENSKLYEEAVEEMRKYTVEPVRDETTGADVNDASIFDNVESEGDSDAAK